MKRHNSLHNQDRNSIFACLFLRQWKGVYHPELWFCVCNCDVLCSFSFGPSLGGAWLCDKGSFIFSNSEETAMNLLVLRGGKLRQQMKHSQRNCRNQHSDEKEVGCISTLTYCSLSIRTLLMGSWEHDSCSRMWAETSMKRKISGYFFLFSIPQGRVGHEEAEGPTVKRRNCIWDA